MDAIRLTSRQIEALDVSVGLFDPAVWVGLPEAQTVAEIVGAIDGEYLTLPESLEVAARWSVFFMDEANAADFVRERAVPGDRRAHSGDCDAIGRIASVLYRHEATLKARMVDPLRRMDAEHVALERRMLPLNWSQRPR